MKFIDPFFMYLPTTEMIHVRVMPAWSQAGVFTGLPYRTTWVHYLDDPEKGPDSQNKRLILCPHFSARAHNKNVVNQRCAICEKRDELYRDALQSYKRGNKTKSEMIDDLACGLTAAEIAVYQVIDVNHPVYGKDSEKAGRPFVQLLYMDTVSHTRLLNILLERQRALEFSRGLVFLMRRQVPPKNIEPLQEGTVVVRFDETPHNLFGGYQDLLDQLQKEIDEMSSHPLFQPPTYKETEEYVQALGLFKEQPGEVAAPAPEEIPAQNEEDLRVLAPTRVKKKGT